MPAPIAITQLQASDAADLISANIASTAYHVPWVHPPTDAAAFDALLAQTLTGPNLTFLARHQPSGGVVGVITFSQIVLGRFRNAYLGFYGMSDFARQGLMRAALAQGLAHVFRTGLHRVEANIQPENTASKALVASLGFREEGFSPRYLHINGAWRDHERWARLADD